MQKTATKAKVKLPPYKQCINCPKLFAPKKNSDKYCRICKPKTGGGRDHNRHLVRARDNFTCQDCGLVRTPEEVYPGMKNLDVHHLGGLCGKLTRAYDHKENMGKMITLCHRCHFNRHDFSKKRQRHVKESTAI